MPEWIAPWIPPGPTMMTAILVGIVTGIICEIRLWRQRKRLTSHKPASP